jgi:phenylalanyl-tRNA synthetase beta chain
MGGLDSGVSDGTTDILFESAWFKPATIMGKARAFGLQTDASHRFERGVDPAGQEAAVERATALLLGIAGGRAGPLLLAEDRGHVPRNRAVSLRHARLEAVLGFGIPRQQVEDILARLGMTVVAGDGQWSVTAPSNRFDLEIEEDLIEEVARIHGYDAIPEAPVTGEVAVGSAGGHGVSRDRLRQELCAIGYQEAVNYSFIDRKLLAAVYQDDSVLPLANPLSADLDAMRTTLLPGLLAALGRNQRRQQGRVRLFELGVVFLQGAQLDEIDRVAAVASGDALPEQWDAPKRPLDFFDVKGDVERLLSLRGGGQTAVFEPVSLAWLHPGASAIIRVQDVRVGWCGAVHPAVLKALEIRKAVLGFELDLEPILARDVPFAKEISRFPSVRRDLALVLPNDVSFDQVRFCVTESAGRLLEKVVVFDVYQGGNLTKGYKSLAIGLIFNDVSSTLRDEDVDPLIEAVVLALGQRLGAQLRG